MKTYSCSCEHDAPLFFESTHCMACGRITGYCEDQKAVLSFDSGQVNGVFIARTSGVLYQQCDNYRQYGSCNGMVPLPEGATAPVAGGVLCFGCHFNDNIPDLSVPAHLALWRKLETAKRRTLYTLDALHLPLQGTGQNPQLGLSFDFLADKDARDHFRSPLEGHDPVLTGHDQGHITINIAEADDVARTAMKMQLGEQYRTLLGHFRHEIGHYYWDVLVKDQPRWLARYREIFGDETVSYQDSLDRHYKEGPPPGWGDRYISEYATMHPWEDFAETWAHYMHIIDTLETAQEYAISMRPVRGGAPVRVNGLNLPQDSGTPETATFERIVGTWIDFSILINSLNRSMGLADAYPFVLTPPVKTKLNYVHDLIQSCQPT